MPITKLEVVSNPINLVKKLIKFGNNATKNISIAENSQNSELFI